MRAPRGPPLAPEAAASPSSPTSSAADDQHRPTLGRVGRPLRRTAVAGADVATARSAGRMPIAPQASLEVLADSARKREELTKPAEGTLYEDPATADLTAKVTEAWAEFGRALAAAPAAAAGRVGARPDPGPDRRRHRRGGVRGDACVPATTELRGVRGEQRDAAAGAPAARARAVGELVALGWSPPGRGGRLGRTVRAEPAGGAGRAAGRDRDPDPARRCTAPRTRRSSSTPPSPRQGRAGQLPQLGAARLDPGGGEDVSRLGPRRPGRDCRCRTRSAPSSRPC